MSGQARVPPALHAPWRGIGGLLTLSVVVAPMVAFRPPADGPTILSEGSLVPLGVVVALIVAVFRAGQQMQRLTDHLAVLEKLVERVAVIEARLAVTDDEGVA